MHGNLEVRRKGSSWYKNVSISKGGNIRGTKCKRRDENEVKVGVDGGKKSLNKINFSAESCFSRSEFFSHFRSLSLTPR